MRDISSLRHRIAVFKKIRAQWSHLFQGPKTMQAFMWPDDLIGVARFVNRCLNKVNPPLLGGQHLISLVWLEEM